MDGGWIVLVIKQDPFQALVDSHDEGTDPFGGSQSFQIGKERVRQVWGIGGGKGGIGKSLVASNLAIALSRMGNKVIAVDLDLGGANLHTALGVNLPKHSLSDFFSDRVTNLQQCVTPTGIPNLEIISGAQDSVKAASIDNRAKAKLFKKLRTLDADYLIFDLGAGTSESTIDFFLYCDIGLITLLPEPTSIENAYRFIKSTYFRKLMLTPKLSEIRYQIELAMDPNSTGGIKSPADLFRQVSSSNPDLATTLKEEISNFSPKLIVNQARTQTDVDIGFSVKSVCKKYFGITLDYIGYLDYDSAVWQAIRRKRPLLLEFPNSRLVSNLERITQHLVKHHGNLKSPTSKFR